MEEIEAPTEHLHEHLHEAAEHAREVWISRVALSSAVLAVFAAIAALMAGQHANEAMLDQIQASNQWNYYQAKGIKSAVLSSRVELLKGMSHEASEKDRAKLEQYAHDQEQISEKAKEKEAGSEHHLQTHEILARSVTMFQVAIALAAITVLMRRKPLWFLSLAFGAGGLVFFIQGLIQARG